MIFDIMVNGFPWTSLRTGTAGQQITWPGARTLKMAAILTCVDQSLTLFARGAWNVLTCGDMQNAGQSSHHHIL